jgi:hypothetical protein
VPEPSIDELKRLFAPFASRQEEERATHYWASSSVAERIEAASRMSREVYRSMGYDVDQPMVKTLCRATFENEAQEGERFHLAAQKFMADR